MAAAFAPEWLAVSDVKAWLRLQQQDSSDDDLLNSVAAMAEPYVTRCRPEWWTNPAAPVPDLKDVPVSAQTTQHPGEPVGLLGDWVAANPFIRPLPGVWQTFTWVPASGETGSDFLNQNFLIDIGGGGAVTVPVELENTGLSVGNVVATWVRNYSVVRLQLVVTPAPHYVWDGVAVPGNRYVPDAETYQGAVMYAAREYRRRNSPAGVEMFGDVTSFVSRFDPDIDRALMTGSYARPVVS